MIPDSVLLGGTMRALTHEHMMYLKGEHLPAAPVYCPPSNPFCQLRLSAGA